DWNRNAPACLVRHAALAGIVLPITRVCAHLRVRGIEALASLTGPVIFASNHQSYLDAPVILAALPPRWRYSIAPAVFKEYFDAHFHPQRHSFVRRLSSGLSFFLATLIFNAFPLPQIEAGAREAIRHI